MPANSKFLALSDTATDHESAERQRSRRYGVEEIAVKLLNKDAPSTVN